MTAIHAEHTEHRPTTTRPDPILTEKAPRQGRSEAWMKLRWVLACVAVWVFVIAANVIYLRWVRS